nr:ABC transporter ATP-binding protein [Ardenticatena sp.]
MPPLLEVQHLVKQYGSVRALDGLDMRVYEGEVYGLLGPNGAGKTTLLSMLFGLLIPDSGTIRWHGHDVAPGHPERLQGIEGFVDTPAFYPHLSAIENVLCTAHRRGQPLTQADVWPHLERVGLADAAHRPVGGFSTGMKKRLGIAQALLFRPRLLILDEPTSGLDPNGVRDMRRLIRALRAEGMSILLSSHILSEVEQIADRIGIISHGRMLCEEKLSVLMAPSGVHDVRVDDAKRAASVLRLCGLRAVAQGDTLRIHVPTSQTIGEIICSLVQHGVRVIGVESERTHLEETFFHILGIRETIEEPKSNSATHLRMEESHVAR